jgi:hypothetical protein
LNIWKNNALRGKDGKMLDISKTACAALAACAIMALAGCTPGVAGPGAGGGPDGYAAASVAAVASGSATGIMPPDDIIGQLAWENLKTGWPLCDYINDIGEPPGGLGVFANRYTWYPDGAETSTDETANFMFSGPIWEEGSVCVEIAIPFEEVVRDWEDGALTVDAMMKMDPGIVRWVPAGGGEKAYFAYDDADAGITLKLYSDESGSRLLADESVRLRQTGLVKPYTAGNYNFERYEPLHSGLRTGPMWAGVNEYGALLGADIDEISACIEHGGFEENDFGYTVYRDYGNGDEYGFAGYTEGKCDYIYLTAEKVLEGFSGIKSGHDFLSEMGLRAEWSEYLGPLFEYPFTDYKVYFFTDTERNIYPESKVIIRKR